VASSRRFHGPSRSRKRLSAWDEGPVDPGTTITGTGVSVWNTGIVLVNESKVTIVRTRGQIMFSIVGAVGADGDRMEGAIALGIVSSDAFAGGVTPDPIDDASWPGWFWYHHFDVTDGDIAGGNNSSAVSRVQRIQIDSKAMRKWGENETIFGVVQAVETGALSVEFVARTRMLFKLS